MPRMSHTLGTVLVDGVPYWRIDGRLLPVIAGGSTNDNLITRADVESRIPDQVAREVIQQLPEASAAMNLFSRVPMTDRMQRLPVLSALPVAYFVGGDTGLKRTTQMAWDGKQLIVEEIAAIVPVPDAVLADSSFDVWAEVRPRLVEAIGRALDDAIFFGTNKPATWPAAIVPGAVAASNTVTRGSTAAQGGIAEDINLTMGKVEDDGFDVNGFVTSRSYRQRFRGARGTDGQPLLDVALNTLYGEPIRYALRGQWPSGAGAAELIAGDFTQGILGVRQDITWKVSSDAVIQDDQGAIVFNTFQQDMTAIRVVFRCAWQVANPMTFEEPNAAARYPFAVLEAA